MSGVRRQDSGVNEELVAKLQSEISMEEDMKEDEDLSANIKEYLENSPFEVESLQYLCIEGRSSQPR
jgi:complement component 1 Q subcomponent-binding protein